MRLFIKSFKKLSRLLFILIFIFNLSIFALSFAESDYGDFYIQDSVGKGYYYDVNNDGIYEYYTYDYEINYTSTMDILAEKTTDLVTTGWKKYENNWMYYENNINVVNDWRLIDNKWYFFDIYGYKVLNWQNIEGKIYYFNTNGEMLVGNQIVDGVIRVFGYDGALIS